MEVIHMLPLRPHHGMCLRGFVGKGYDSVFTANMQRIANHLAAQPEQTVCLVIQPDVLCVACPHCLADECESRRFVQPLDAACLRACGLEQGVVLPWKQYRELIDRQIFKTRIFDRLCAACEWYTLCKRAAPRGSD